MSLNWPALFWNSSVLTCGHSLFCLTVVSVCNAGARLKIDQNQELGSSELIFKSSQTRITLVFSRKLE